MAKPKSDHARTERVMVRLTPKELEYIAGRGRARARSHSGLTKADGSVNLSAVIRHIVLDGMK